MFLGTNYTEYSQYGTQTNHVRLCCTDAPDSDSVTYLSSNITYRIILDNRTATYDHPDVTNPFISKLTHWQDDVLGAYLFIVGLVALGLNGFNIRVSLLNRQALKPPELFVINVMICDVMMIISTFPLSVGSFFAHGWLGGQNTCRMYGFFSYLFGYAELLSLMVLALVRYMVICGDSLTARRQLTETRCKTLIGCLHSFALVLALFPFSPLASYGPEVSGVSCAIEWMLKENQGFVITVCVTTFMGPMTSMLFCYSSILAKVNKTRDSLKQHNRSNHPSQSSSQQSLMCAFLTCSNPSPSISMARMTGLMWLSFLICWGPYAIISFVSAFSNYQLTPVVSILPGTFCKTSVMLNPLIYYTMSKRYRSRLKMTMMSACKKTSILHKPEFLGTQL